MQNNNSLYNLEKLYSLSGGNNEFIKKMVALFSDQAPKSAVEMSEAFENRDFEKLKAVAHRMKPSIDNMGIPLGTEIRQIEQLAANKTDSEEMKSLVGLYLVKIEEVVNDLKQMEI